MPKSQLIQEETAESEQTRALEQQTSTSISTLKPPKPLNIQSINSSSTHSLLIDEEEKGLESSSKPGLTITVFNVEEEDTLGKKIPKIIHF